MFSTTHWGALYDIMLSLGHAMSAKVHCPITIELIHEVAALALRNLFSHTGFANGLMRKRVGPALKN